MSLQIKFSENILKTYPSAFEWYVNEYHDDLQTQDSPECFEELSVIYRKLELMKGTVQKHVKRLIRETGYAPNISLIMPLKRKQLPEQPRGEDKFAYFADLGGIIIDPYRRFTPSGTENDVNLYCLNQLNKLKIPQTNINVARVEQVRVYQ